MKKIGNFTQTYQAKDNWSLGSDGKDREFLIDYMLRDREQIKIRKLFDLHSYTFHNMEFEKSKKIASKIKKEFPDTEFFCYNNMTFGETILRHINFLKSKGITDLIWIQDDDFFTGIYDEFEAIYNYYKNNDNIKHLNISIYNVKHLNTELNNYKKIEIGNNLHIYKTKARDFQNQKMFGMDNSPFICNIDYLLERIYTKEVFDAKYLNAYDLEGHININGSQNNIDRYTVNRIFFEPHNIVGMGGSLGNAKQALEQLESRFGKL
jgi:hypothetical protein